MKQKIYILGLVTVLILALGTLLKLNHYPGGAHLLVLGIVLLVLVFLPKALMNHYNVVYCDLGYLFCGIYRNAIQDFALAFCGEIVNDIPPISLSGLSACLSDYYLKNQEFQHL
jgi:hypothetical protein